MDLGLGGLTPSFDPLVVGCHSATHTHRNQLKLKSAAFSSPSSQESGFPVSFVHKAVLGVLFATKAEGPYLREGQQIYGANKEVAVELRYTEPLATPHTHDPLPPCNTPLRLMKRWKISFICNMHSE